MLSPHSPHVSHKKKRLILLGCGHAHVFVLEMLAKNYFQNTEVILVSPEKDLYYSGILPSVIAGHIDSRWLTLDVPMLAKRASVKLIQQKAIDIDADKQCVTLEDGQMLCYDWLSINIGASPKNPWQSDHKHVQGIKPISKFITTWQTLSQSNDADSIAVIGGGAAAVEMVLAIKHATPNDDVTLISPSLLPEQPVKIQTQIKTYFAKTNITYKAQRVDDINQVQTDHIFVAIGAEAPHWLQNNTLAKDESGFISVNAYHQSISHANVFATGDVCSRSDVGLPKAGVYAVRAGEVLTNNLRELLATHSLNNLKPYTPSNHVLQILALGNKRAIAIYGDWVISGRWVWFWKRFIDIGFVKRFQKLDDR